MTSLHTAKVKWTCLDLIREIKYQGSLLITFTWGPMSLGNPGKHISISGSTGESHYHAQKYG